MLIWHQTNWVTRFCLTPTTIVIIIIINREWEHITRSGCTMLPLSEWIHLVCTYIYSHRTREREKKKGEPYAYMYLLLGSRRYIVSSYIHVFFCVLALYCSAEHHQRSSVWCRFIHRREWENDEIDSSSKNETTGVVMIAV
jgi:hypothetical protein